jgi:predicted RNA-binding protein with PUA-like domain
MGGVLKIHNLKSHTIYFKDIVKGIRTHELRKNDRGYQIGDLLFLQEWNVEDSKFTGDNILVKVTAMTSTDIPCAESKSALNPEFCILSVTKNI